MNPKILISYLFIIFLVCSLTEGNAQSPFRIVGNFSKENIPPIPDYQQLKLWAAHPDKIDKADTLPYKSNLTDGQVNAKADVFFIHPTIFTYEPKNNFRWNADVNDEELNQRVDESTIMNQATAFNGSCRVFAPRYRQAHYSVFTTSNPENKKQGLDVAYEDVKNAFLHYLKNHNNGRPIVIAAHSQGTIHAGRLIKEFIEGKSLQKQFVEAYLIGIATPPDYFETIKPSNSPNDIGGFVTWNTFKKGYTPDYYNGGLHKAVCTNPLTWKTDATYAPRKLNSGGVGLKFTFVEQLVDAQVHKGMLWIGKPNIFGAALIRTKIWHKADINFFWMNIRENVALRVDTFLQQK